MKYSRRKNMRIISYRHEIRIDFCKRCCCCCPNEEKPKAQREREKKEIKKNTEINTEHEPNYYFRPSQQSPKK